MFEQYTFSARRVIFYARQEAGDMGASSIESEHLLIGVLRENKELLPPGVADQICRSLKAGTPEIAAPADYSAADYAKDMPVSEESTRVLKLAEKEARKLGHKMITPGHLLLALLRAEVSPGEKSRAASVLNEYHVDAVTFRNHMVPPNPSDFEGRNYV